MSKGTKGTPIIDLEIPQKPVKEVVKPTVSQVKVVEKPINTFKPSENLSKKEAADMATLTFKISPELKKEFRIEAAELDISLTELLQKSFSFWKENHK